LEFVGEYDEKEPKSWGGKDLKKITTKALFESYSLNGDTIDFIGHGMALRANDNYLNEPAVETVKRIRLYGESVMKYGNSPYIYPLYGIGEMPQGFARLSAIYGGTYMLNKPPLKINYVDGVFNGVSIQDDETNTVKDIKANILVGDPSYFPDKIKKVGQVARCIVILHHPIPNTADADSCQIIVSQKEAKRKNDIYVSCVSHSHLVAPKGKYIALVSTIVETENPLRNCNQGWFYWVLTKKRNFSSVLVICLNHSKMAEKTKSLSQKPSTLKPSFPAVATISLIFTRELLEKKWI